MRGYCVNYEFDLKRILEARVEMITFGLNLKGKGEGGTDFVIMGQSCIESGIYLPYP